jgi:tRNA uridine 5-carbamoylmethylation protein Kti12
MQKLKVILFKGLPGSGKTTEARKIMNSHKGKYKRINKDDLRAMFDNGHFSFESIEMTLDIRDAVMLYFICKGFNVIIDDTNLAPINEKRITDTLKSFINNKKVEIIIKDLTKIHLDICIKRDKLRENPIGAKIIRKMYNKYIK